MKVQVDLLPLHLLDDQMGEVSLLYEQQPRILLSISFNSLPTGGNTKWTSMILGSIKQIIRADNFASSQLFDFSYFVAATHSGIDGCWTMIKQLDTKFCWTNPFKNQLILTIGRIVQHYDDSFPKDIVGRLWLVVYRIVLHYSNILINISLSKSYIFCKVMRLHGWRASSWLI